jgi:hypothetical protein
MISESRRGAPSAIKIKTWKTAETNPTTTKGKSNKTSELIVCN